MKHIGKTGPGNGFPYIGELFKTSIGVVEFWADSFDCIVDGDESLLCHKCVLWGKPDCRDVCCLFCVTPVEACQECLGITETLLDEEFKDVRTCKKRIDCA